MNTILIFILLMILQALSPWLMNVTFKVSLHGQYIGRLLYKAVYFLSGSVLTLIYLGKI